MKGAPSLCTCRKELNKYDLTATQSFWLAHHSVSGWPIIMIRPGDLLLVVPHRFAVRVSVLWMGVAKKYITKLECEKFIFTRSRTEHHWRCSLSSKDQCCVGI